MRLSFLAYLCNCFTMSIAAAERATAAVFGAVARPVVVRAAVVATLGGCWAEAAAASAEEVSTAATVAEFLEPAARPEVAALAEYWVEVPAAEEVVPAAIVLAGGWSTQG